jgi:predicted negative regulator of RcsB-dependent stress response
LRWGLLAIVASLIVLGWVVFRRDAAAPLATEKRVYDGSMTAMKADEAKSH